MKIWLGISLQTILVVRVIFDVAQNNPFYCFIFHVSLPNLSFASIFSAFKNNIFIYVFDLTLLDICS